MDTTPLGLLLGIAVGMCLLLAIQMYAGHVKTLRATRRAEAIAAERQAKFRAARAAAGRQGWADSYLTPTERKVTR